MVDRSKRRAFLRGHFQDTQSIRPPGAIEWHNFVDQCDRCDACATACPEGIIAFDGEGFPVVEPQAGSCTFCGACTEACPTDALQPEQPWPWKALVSEACLSMGGIQCRACEDHCDQRAIRFRPALGGKTIPQIDMDNCTGCAGCVAPCPVGAISLARAPHNAKETVTC